MRLLYIRFISTSLYQFFIFDNSCQNKYLRNFYKNLYCLCNSNIIVVIFINLLLSMYICTTRFNNYQLYVQFSGWVYPFYQIGGENRGRNDLSYHSMARIEQIVKSNTSTWFFKSLSFACKFTAMIIICKMQITRWFFSHPQRINLNSVLSKVRQRHQSCACIVCTYVCKTAWGRHASE